jgi:hypothetical protein
MSAGRQAGRQAASLGKNLVKSRPSILIDVVSSLSVSEIRRLSFPYWWAVGTR